MSAARIAYRKSEELAAREGPSASMSSELGRIVVGIFTIFMLWILIGEIVRGWFYVFSSCILIKF